MKTATSRLKIVILGAPQVGKSAVAVRFLTRRFIGEYSSGTDCTYHTMFQHEDTTHRVEIVDCTSESDASHQQRVTDADAFILVYSIIDTPSLKHLHSILSSLQPHHHNPTLTPTPILLLGNKTDLHHLRQVSHHDVTRLTQQYPACRHREISAAESCTAVDETMQELLAECAEEKKKRERSLPPAARLVPKRRRKSLLGNVSRRLGRVFRRKSLDEFQPARRRDSSGRVAENLNRRSV